MSEAPFQAHTHLSLKKETKTLQTTRAYQIKKIKKTDTYTIYSLKYRTVRLEKTKKPDHYTV